MATFSKQPYTKIAALLHSDLSNTANALGKDHLHYQILCSIAWQFAAMFERDNPRFDCGRFIAACSLSE